MGSIRFFHADELSHVRVRDLYDTSTDSDITQKPPEDEMDGQSVGFIFPGNESELQLFEVKCEPNMKFNTHTHDEDQIFYVVAGDMFFGCRRFTTGSAIYVPGRTLYSFTSGPDGLRVLNFRPRRDTTYHTREDLIRERDLAGQSP